MKTFKKAKWIWVEKESKPDTYGEFQWENVQISEQKNYMRFAP